MSKRGMGLPKIGFFWFIVRTKSKYVTFNLWISKTLRNWLSSLCLIGNEVRGFHIPKVLHPIRVCGRGTVPETIRTSIISERACGPVLTWAF